MVLTAARVVPLRDGAPQLLGPKPTGPQIEEKSGVKAFHEYPAHM